MAKYGPKPKPMEERFWTKVKKGRGKDACWEWTGGKNNKGYGTFMPVSPRNRLAHRVSWAMSQGITIDEIPEGTSILHHCDNPLCVRPAHLFTGSIRDNAIDMVKKGRGRYVVHHGPDNGFSKLTEDDVREIRRIYATDHSVTQKDLAERFGVSKGLISRIWTRMRWKHVE